MQRIMSHIPSPTTDESDARTKHSKRDREDKYLMTVEAAEFLRLSPRTLERMRVDGTGPRFLKAGPGLRARVLYRQSDLEAWLESFSFASTSEYDGGR